MSGVGVILPTLETTCPAEEFAQTSLLGLGWAMTFLKRKLGNLGQRARLPFISLARMERYLMSAGYKGP
jgi:hypothetical protein